MDWVPVLLLAIAVAILVAAEWPRLAARFGDAPGDRRRKRHRKGRRKDHLSVVPSSDEAMIDDDREAFAASVARDLESLPTIDDRQ